MEEEEKTVLPPTSEPLPMPTHHPMPDAPANLPVVLPESSPSAPPPVVLPPAPPKNAPYGALVSIIIILLIVIVGAFYAWGQRIAADRTPSPTVELPDGGTAQ